MIFAVEVDGHLELRPRELIRRPGEGGLGFRVQDWGFGIFGSFLELLHEDLGLRGCRKPGVGVYGFIWCRV